MRLGWGIATWLVLEQCYSSHGFSLQHSFIRSSTSTSTYTSTWVSSSSLSLSSETALREVGGDQVKEISSKDVDQILGTLEKRMTEGPGSVSLVEVEEFESMTERLLNQMKKPVVPATSQAPDQRDISSVTSSDISSDISSITPNDLSDIPINDGAAAVADPLDLWTMPNLEEMSPEDYRAAIQASLTAGLAAGASASADVGVTESVAFVPEIKSEKEEIMHTHTPSSLEEGDNELLFAISQMDATSVSEMLKAGAVMDEETTEAAFWEVVNAIDRAEAEDQPLPADVPRMIHHIFDADQRLLQQREKITTNLTCMQPDDSGGIEAASRRMNYVFDDGDHKNLPLKEGRRCEGGNCCDKCSRNIFPTFATDRESNLNRFPKLSSITLNELDTVASCTILQFVRLVERVRRSIAHEYGLPLSTILPLQAYSRKYVAGTTQRGGGGGEGDYVTLHTDEATHDGYHYSCVLYLSTHGEDFQGGNFVFNDPATGDEQMDQETLESLPIEEQIRRVGRNLIPFHPTRGSAVIFSSGWENMHEVETITSGVRFAVPCFFTTCPVPDVAYDQMKVGKPKSDEDIADDWLHLLLAHRKEKPLEGVARVKELLMKWHYICAPLSEH